MTDSWFILGIPAAVALLLYVQNIVRLEIDGSLQALREAASRSGAPAEPTPIAHAQQLLRARAEQCRKLSWGALAVIIAIVIGGVMLFIYAPRLARSSTLPSTAKMKAELEDLEKRSESATEAADSSARRLAVLVTTATVPRNAHETPVRVLREYELAYEGHLTGRLTRRHLPPKYESLIYDSDKSVQEIMDEAKNEPERNERGYLLGSKDYIAWGVAFREVRRHINAREYLENATTTRASLVAAISQSEGGQGNAWSDIATRISSALLIIFVVQILSTIYRHQARLAVLYDSRADALVLAQDDRLNSPDAIDRVAKLVQIVGSEHVDFDEAPNSIANTLVEKAGDVAKKAMPG